MSLENIQKKFIPHDGIYLLIHSVGRPLVTSQQHCIDNFFIPWSTGDAEVWPHWMEGIGTFQKALAKLFNSTEKSFCPQVNLSSALTKILYSLPYNTDRRTILMCEDDFPSLGFLCERTKDIDYTVKFIPSTLNPQDPDVWKQYLTDDVFCAIITHVHSNNSRLLPIDEITRITRQREIVSVIDVAQSSGIVPIDLTQWDCDFVIGSSVKFLCGGPGAGFLWVNDDILPSCRPLDVGWFSHENPFEFDIHNFRFAQDSSRFFGGTPSVLPFVTAAHSIDTIADIGVTTIRNHSQMLTERVSQAVDDRYLVSPIDKNKRGGTVVINYPENMVKKFTDNLTANNIRFDQRKTGIRLSPHVYTTEDEISTLVQCLGSVQ